MSDRRSGISSGCMWPNKVTRIRSSSGHSSVELARKIDQHLGCLSPSTFSNVKLDTNMPFGQRMSSMAAVSLTWMIIADSRHNMVIKHITIYCKSRVGP